MSVTVRRDSRKRLSSLFVEGHAGWAEAGEDVVCAAVSAIVQATWLGLEQVARVPLSAERSEGRIALRWPPEARSDGVLAAIVATAELSLEQIAAQYPEHVRFARETER